jgi:polyisoprenoid-binding protein YceI
MQLFKQVNWVIVLSLTQFFNSTGFNTYALAGALQLQEGASPQVEFNATGRPSALKIKGTGTQLKPQLELTQGKLKGSVEFDLTSLETGLSLRDKHMKEKYLEVEKFPKSTFELNETPLPEALTQPGNGAESPLPLKGKLTLHGVTREVDVTATASKAEGVFKIQAQFDIKLTDYGISIPKFAGITVAEDVKLNISLSLNEAK